MGFFSSQKKVGFSADSSVASSKQTPASPKAVSESAGKNEEVSATNREAVNAETMNAETVNAETNCAEIAPEDQNEDDDVAEKKKYAKEKAPLKKMASNKDDDDDDDDNSETETSLNTKINAMLYHTSEDSIDMYRNENNSSDLLGRLYYDDYDPSNRHVVESVSSFSSIHSPRGSGSPGLNGPGTEQVPSNSFKPRFARQVSFDTLCNTHHSAITLKVKHPEFKFRRNNKTFLIGFSDDSESIKAVAWVFLEMVISGDTIIVFQVLDEKANSCIDAQSAETVLEKLQKLNTHSKRISLVYEVVIGNPQKLLKKAILEYKPAMMVVGTKHYGSSSSVESSRALSPSNSSSSIPTLSSLSHPQPVRGPPPPQTLPRSHSSSLHRSFFSKASTSKYFLQYALVPVIIVKPFYNIQETLEKPVDSEDYFSDWLANIDISHTREKKKKHMFGVRSRSSSRNSSHVSLTDFLHHDRSQEKLSDNPHEKPHERRGRSVGDRLSFTMGESRESSPARSQSRSSRTLERRGDDSTVESNSRSRSRSRLSRLFS